MSILTRRKFMQLAASIGATLAWPSIYGADSISEWKERRDLFPQGVASGDPHPDSIILWTRRPPTAGNIERKLHLELAEDETFKKIISKATAEISAETDWTCRVLAAGLQPRRVYWFRFTDQHGAGSRIGRTITAPADTDDRPIQFTFVSCQNVQQGSCDAYRKMIYEDNQRAPEDQLGFVLHLGDFIYEIVWYPEDRKQGMYDRRLRDIVRFSNGEKIDDFHIPKTLEDYRAVYRAYLTDPDLQDARARWPFICVWDNHEFSWRGWQSQQQFQETRPAQKLKVAANQAWYEYQPARVKKSGDPKKDRFEAPVVADAPLTKFDTHGLGLDEGNLAAINSLQVYRSFRYGKNVDLLITDNHSYRSQPVTDLQNANQFQSEQFSLFFPEDVYDVLDAGNKYNNGKPPDTLLYDGKEIPNFRKNQPPQSLHGIKQEKWFLGRLTESTAVWKLWGNSNGLTDLRIDVQNLPADFPVKWRGTGYGDMSGVYKTSRAEILEFIKQKKITGFVAIAGDRHSFFSGLISASLPPKSFEPVGAEFVTGSISAPGLVEALSYRIPKDDPIRPLFLHDPPTGGTPQGAVNFALLNGVRAVLALQRTGDIHKAYVERNPEVAPHLKFADMGGHGYSMVRATSDEVEVEFVCIPRPIERSMQEDGGPVSYRVTHRVKRWNAGETPRIERTKEKGTLPLVI